MERKTISSPDGRGDDKLLTYGASVETTLSVSIPGDGMEGPTFALVDAPTGSNQLYVQNRRCGDWYAEFSAGPHIKCAIGEGRLTAITNAAMAMGA